MNIKNLNFAVVGSGSIGLRHTKNLKHLGATKISVFDPNKKQKPFVEELGFNFVTNSCWGRVSDFLFECCVWFRSYLSRTFKLALFWIIR